ncbi:neuron navigator 2 isoform X6 [Silurus asotus]|uniref:Neuron navigator 2 isoform X6 n=1 Tax=Silurus asotus TaxID=30991 RepID=A0AAD5FGN8_SILAS|nr:neuron navigator 2 isoform X6 [Silurus asotus]
MPAILVSPKMKSGLPKPVHSALPIPQAHIQTRAIQSSGAKLMHHSSLRRSSQTSSSAPQRKSLHTSNETSTDPQIYTDWANYYLAKSGHKRLIRDLQQDVADGVLLAELIQVVANERIADINGYPENRSQMIENIDACLGFLAAKGVNIKGLCAEEIRSGNLKAILGLFFSLSRYKQQQQHEALKQAKDETQVLQVARVQCASPSQVHSPWCTPHTPSCPVHIHEQDTSASGLKTQEDMQSRLPGPSIQPRRSSSRRSQSFIHRDESPTLTCSQHTDKSSPSPVMLDQEPPSSPVLQSGSTSSTKGWRSKSLNAKHSATSSILSIKQPSSPSLEVPPKVIAQKSMLDKLKLFNSRPSSRASSTISLEDPEGSNTDLNEANICHVHPEAHLGNQQPLMASNSSPKLALKGIAQRTLSRTLVPKAKASEKDKDKVKMRGKTDKDKTTKRSSGVEQNRNVDEQNETRAEPSNMTEGKKSSLIPKGTKSHSNTKKEVSSQSGIPKPGHTSKVSGVIKNSVALPGGKVENSRAFRTGGSLLAYKCSMENKNSNSATSLVEGRCSHNISTSIAQTSNVNNIQLPQTQHSHPNTATVAPFMYRSQTDVDKSGMSEGGEWNKERSNLRSKSIHTSLESLKEKKAANVSENPSVPSGWGIEEWSQKTQDTTDKQYSHTEKITDLKMESEIHSLREPDLEEPETGDSISWSPAPPSPPGSRGMLEISMESIKDEDPELSTSAGFKESSCACPSEEKNSTEDAKKLNKECEVMHTQGHMYQLHLSQHTGAWDSIARVNQEILLTMLDIYEKYKSEDSESKRLRTVKNIADLRQNLEETMSSLRHVTHISHSTLQTTFDACITTEISTKGSLGLTPCPVSASPWRQSASSPRLQAGDAPSLDSGYSNTGVMLEGMTTDSAGYVSDGDILGKSVRMDSATSGYVTDGGQSVYTHRIHKHSSTLLHCESRTDIDSWDDSSSVSSGISDALDTDELNTSSSLSSFVNTPSAPRRDIEEQLQTDAEKRSAFGCGSTWNEALRRPDGCSDPDVAMETNSKWCNPSDFSDELENGLTRRKPHTISQTGSWRRGMSTQMGITNQRTKTPNPTNCSPLKIHSNGKTDDAKVSEKSRFSPQIPTYESKKLPSSSGSHTPTNTFGFKKTSSSAIITASGAVLTSGSATLGKIPKSIGFSSSRLVGKHTSVDDGYLPPSSRTTLQYRSLPRPSRSNSGMGTTRSTGRPIDASPISKGTATLPNPKSRSLARSNANKTDREKGVFSETDSLALGPINKASCGAQCQPGRQTAGKSSDTSPTLRRLFGSKPGTKPTPNTTSENMKNSTIISNPHTTSSIQTCSLVAAPVSSGGTRGVLHGETPPIMQNSTSNDSMKASLGKEVMHSTCSERTSTVRAGQSDRYSHLPQGRAHDDARDWMNCHPNGGNQDLPGSCTFSPASTLSSPPATRFNFNTIGTRVEGSQTMAVQINPAIQRLSSSSANQDGPHEQHADSRLRNATLNLVEKTRTMSSSGSFREPPEEVHGSSLSLVSNTSSVYSTPEEKSQSEIRKLRRELEASQEKVSTLTTQLSANAHLVAAFEQSLGNMTIRLQSLTTTAEQKDSELNEMRKTIELLKKQNIAAQAAISGVINTPVTPNKDSSSGSSLSAAAEAADLQIQRQPSSDSVSSITSHSSLELDANSKKKRKNWLRSSFKQAFSKKKAPKSASSHSDVEEMDESSAPSSPRLPYGCHSAGTSLLRHSHSNSLISECTDCETEAVMHLRSELRDKEMKLTDIRLEALSSAHQLDQLRESMNCMQVEMEKLKVENERLRTPSRESCSTTTSQPSVCPSNHGLSTQLSLTESTSLDMLLEDSSDGGSRKDGHHVKVVVSLNRDPERKEGCRRRDFLIGCIGVSNKTKWEVLDGVIRRLFKEYIIHVDPVSQLGLTTDSVLSYGIGDVRRTSEADTPELLPCGYLVGNSDTISVHLKGVEEHSEDALVFETLIPKPILNRYVSQLKEHRRIVLSGPSGTGKSYLAMRLAEHMVLMEGLSLSKQLITSFNVDNKSSKELKQYLSNLTEQCISSTRAAEAPRVVVIENLHHLGSLSEIFNGLLNCKHQRCPYIICTINQTSSTTSTPDLQLHHNFRWLLCANHAEPVKGFLGRFLQRKLLETEISSRTRNADLVKIIEWIPCVWQHLNHFLEKHSSSDVTIGPRLFLSCPMDVEGSQVWFTDLWNYSIIPYMLDAVRVGLQLYGRKAAWEDPSLWVLENYPWPPGPQQLQCPSLLQLRREDVGFDSFPCEPGTQGTEITLDGAECDPLMSMLMRLKEAAHCTGTLIDDSDSLQQL